MLVCLWRSFCTKFCYFGVCASGARKFYVFTQRKRKIFRTIVTYYVICEPLTGVRIGGWYTCRSLFVTLKRSICMLQILWCSGISKNKCISIDLSFHVARTCRSSWFVCLLFLTWMSCVKCLSESVSCLFQLNHCCTRGKYLELHSDHYWWCRSLIRHTGTASRLLLIFSIKNNTDAEFATLCWHVPVRSHDNHRIVDPWKDDSWSSSSATAQLSWLTRGIGLSETVFWQIRLWSDVKQKDKRINAAPILI